MIVGVAEFAPDMPDLSDATSIASNVIALTPQSYGALRDLYPYTTNAIDTVCLGMGSAEDSALVHNIFAGTAAKLWAISAGSLTWTDRTGLPYSTGTENWRFAQFNDLMTATNFNDPIQYWNMTGGGGFGRLSAAAPNARFLAVAKGFLITANTNDPVDGLNPARLWWSAFNAPTFWPTPGTSVAQQNMSDFNDLPGPLGQITGLAPNLSGCDCAVLFERGVFRMIFSGPPAVFDFYPASSAKGCPAPNSIVQRGAIIDYYGEDGFYSFDGTENIPIGANKVDRWFSGMLDQSKYQNIIGALDVSNKASCWAFTSIYSSDGNPDMMLIYRWDIQRWSVANIPMQWLARIPVVTDSAGSPPSIAGLAAGQLQLAAINPTERLAFFAGQNLAAQIGTKVQQLTPNRRTFVNATRPLVDSQPTQSLLSTEAGVLIVTEAGDFLETEAALVAPLTVAMSARNSYQDVEVFGPDQGLDVSGQCSQRSDGRYHRGRISIPAGSFWTTCAGLDMTGLGAGSR